MANWKKLLKDVLLADGKIDSDEAALLSREILADGVVDDDEVDFLVDLRDGSKAATAAFDQLFFASLKSNILADGAVDKAEVDKLRRIIFADGTVDSNEKKFLDELKASAKKLCPEFETLYEECMKA